MSAFECARSGALEAPISPFPPKDVVEDEVSATYTNGVLEVRLPVLGTTTRGKTIPIEE